MRNGIMSILLGLMLASPLWAATPEEQIIATLQEQGYHVVTRDRTWLGRVWLIVENAELRREIVFNPGTGEILRDYAVQLMAVAEPKGGKSARTPDSAGVVSAVEIPTEGDLNQSVVVGEPVLVLPVPEN